MTTTLEDAPPITADVESRRGLLALFGLIEILLGAACLGILCVVAVLWFFASRLPAEQAPVLETSNLVLSVLLYASGAAFFATMGIGTIYARRWARAVMLVVSWPWLLSMIAVLIFVGALIRPLIARLQESGGTFPAAGTLPSGASLPPGAGLSPTVLIAIPLGVGVLLTLLPAAFIVFYSHPHVVRHFNTADRRPCWTDGRPLSVLGLALVMWLTAATCLVGVFVRAFALFGVMLTGPVAIAASLAAAGLIAWLGFGIYRMTPAGWWANLGFAVLFHLSWWTSLKRLGLEGVLGAAQADPARMQAFRQSGLAALFGSSWLVALSAAIWIGALVGLKGCFRTAPTPSRREDRPSPIRRFPAA